MRCPVCHQAMMVVEREQIELDYCMEQHGVWFDRMELMLLLEESDQEKIKQSDVLLPSSSLEQWQASSSEQAKKESSRQCPHCKAHMEKGHLNHCDTVLIDRCPHDHGLWFDHGELEHLIQWMSSQQAEGNNAKDEATKILAYVGHQS